MGTPHWDRPPKATEEAAAEGIAKTDKRGRPKKRAPFRTILDRVDYLQTIVLEQGMEGFDPAFEAKRGALQGCLVYDEVIYDMDTPALKKAELVARMVPFWNLLRDMAPKGENMRYPKTAELLDNEAKQRLERISKIKPEAGTEAILTEMAPAAAVPAEEA